MSEDLIELPDSWCWTNLEDISDKITDGSHNPPPKKEEGIPMLSARNVFNDKIEFTNVRYISDLDFKREYKRAPIEAGDVLLTTVGTIGRSNVVNETHKKFAIQRSVSLIKSNINSHFLSYYFQSPSSNQYLISNARGTAQKGIYINQLKIIPVPIPPIDEQRRIVNKMEELFTKLDAGIQELTLAKEKLKVYRQSVLKYAFEGKLTEEWRESHKGETEISSILNKIDASSKKKLGRKYKEFSSLDELDLPELPNEWEWLKLGLVADKVSDGTHHSPKIQFDEPGKDRFLYVTSKNIKPSGVVLKNITYVDKEVHQEIYNRCNPELGDVLLIKDGAMTGRSTINNLDEEFSLLSSVALIKLNSDYLLPKYVNYYINSPMGQKSILGGVSGVAITRTNLKKINNTPIPFIGIKEQEMIVESVENILSKIEKNEEIIEISLLQAQKLRQSILKKAFSGQLVPQDPNDEPAEKLLKRIKAQKEKQKTQRKSKQKRLVK